MDHLVLFSLIFIAVAPAFGAVLFTPALLKWQEAKKITAVNYTGKNIASAGGLLFLGVLLLLQPLYLVAPGSNHPWLFMFIFPFAAALLGLADDLWGDTKSKGFWGHMWEFWKRGIFTTGLIKAAGGLVAGVLSAALLANGRWQVWLLGGVFMALCSNLLNIFDTRPGRAAKVFVVLSMLLILVERSYIFLAVPFWSALPLYLFWESREKVMLGDTGAYLLGGIVGVYGIMALQNRMLVLLVFVLLVVHWLCERYSLSRFLDSCETRLAFRQSRRN